MYSHNTKSIDDDAPRVSFVREPVHLKLKGEHSDNVNVEVHPNHPSRGMRNFDVSNKSIWVEKQDLEKSEIRLKGFADITLQNDGKPTSAQIGSIERNARRPIVHWLPESGSVKATLITAEDGEIKHQNGLLESHSYPHGTMVQVERIGYARVIDSTTLMFTHS